jgi:hypothetical protein
MWKSVRESFRSWWLGINNHELYHSEIDALLESGIDISYFLVTDV